MTLKNLQARMTLEPCAGGEFFVRIEFNLPNGIAYAKGYSNDTLAYDRVHEDLLPREKGTDGLTLKQAYQRIYNEITRKQ